MIKKINLVSFFIPIAFYFLLGYLLLGNSLAILSVGFGGILFLFLSSSVAMMLLYSDEIRDGKYSKDHVILSVNLTHIFLVISFIFFVTVYDNYIGDISPALGYVVMSISLVINVLCLVTDIKKGWVWIVLSLHILMFIIFICWHLLGITLILLAFIYMVVHNVFVVNYGILRYSKLFFDRRI